MGAVMNKKKIINYLSHRSHSQLSCQILHSHTFPSLLTLTCPIGTYIPIGVLPLLGAIIIINSYLRRHPVGRLAHRSSHYDYYKLLPEAPSRRALAPSGQSWAADTPEDTAAERQAGRSQVACNQEAWGEINNKEMPETIQFNSKMLSVGFNESMQVDETDHLIPRRFLPDDK
jgi:hypothetical protein